MKKYKLVKKIEGMQEEVGSIFYIEGLHYEGNIFKTRFFKPHEIALLVNAGFLEEVVESKEWEPERQERYYCIHNNGVYTSVWCNDSVDEERKNGFGIYRTEEEAQEMLNYLVECRKKKQGL